MSVVKDSKNSAQADWHRADIVAALHKKGWTLRELSRQSGLGAGTLKSALDHSYPKAENIIAEAIGVPPERICGSRQLSWPVGVNYLGR